MSRTPVVFVAAVVVVAGSVLGAGIATADPPTPTRRPARPLRRPG